MAARVDAIAGVNGDGYTSGNPARTLGLQISRADLGRLLADRHMDLELDAAACTWLADAGYDPAYGARPLKRVIQRTLQNPLAGLILEGEVQDGEVVRVTAGDDGLVINGIKAVAA